MIFLNIITTRLSSFSLALLCLFIANVAIAQDYVPPSDLVGEGYKIVITDISSDKIGTSYRVTFFNTSRDQFLSVNPLKLGVQYKNSASDDGVYYYNSKLSKIGNQNFVVGPGEDKSKLIKVLGDFDHRSPEINIHIDGLKQGKMPSVGVGTESYTLSSGDEEEMELPGFVWKIEKVSSKGGFTAKTKIEFPEYSADDYLILFDSKKVTALGADGAKLSLKVNAPNKSVLDYDSDMAITFKIEEEVGSATVLFGSAFKRIALADVSVVPFELMSTKMAKELNKMETVKVATVVEPEIAGTLPTTPNMCSEIINTTTKGAVLVKMVSDVGCFKLYTAGKEINAEYTSSLSFKSDPGLFTAKIYMESGQVIEKKMMIGEDYKVAYYNVKLKKDKYSVKLSLLNSQPIDEPIKLTETTFGPDELTCRDQFIEWNSSGYTRNLTVVGMTLTHIRYVTCDAPTTVMQIHKKNISFVEYADGSEDEISSIQYPYKPHNVTRSREDMYQKHLKK